MKKELNKQSNHILIFVLIILVGAMTLAPNIQSANADTILSDDFESGNFSAWTGTRMSLGETIGVSSYRSFYGACGAKATSNGGGGSEYAFCYKTISNSEVYAIGGFYVAQNGIAEDGDRFYLIVLRAGSNEVACAGWKKTGGVLRWVLMIRSGTGTVQAYSTTTPSLNKYYQVELHWKKDAVNGIGRLWVDGSRVCYLSGRNTATARALDDLLPSIMAPCLLYAGEKDPFHDRAGEAANHIQQAAFVSIPGLEHSTVFERSDLILPHAKRFLTSVTES